MAVKAPTHSAENPGFGAILWDYMTTTDHKKIGNLYIGTSVFGFAVAGILAVLLRLQLMVPNNTFLVGNTYNQVLTLHAAIMIFFFLIPIGLFGFGNWLVPLQLGVRDVALPRLNNFAVWLFIFSMILVLTACFTAACRASAGPFTILYRWTPTKAGSRC